MAPAKDSTTPDPAVPEVPEVPATDPPADPPAPPADPTPAETPALCAECFPWGLPEGYLTAGCEHSG